MHVNVETQMLYAVS